MLGWIASAATIPVLSCRQAERRNWSGEIGMEPGGSLDLGASMFGRHRARGTVPLIAVIISLSLGNGKRQADAAIEGGQSPSNGARPGDNEKIRGVRHPMPTQRAAPAWAGRPVTTPHVWSAVGTSWKALTRQDWRRPNLTRLESNCWSVPRNWEGVADVMWTEEQLMR
ncbi:hypothetical protein CC85DRAFT_202822 [Cutaneotrichosporon oleaginosum]|uniref:Uncharacterized protein n=1 Tax=Cutaneotrichosporon oleaginosum TaxID=879819 RepID=A0A0J1BA17_9TREE|nr:uncharacterized protein CC85DRAFT_202822 [Cutaneotrichosporon oleaginosum]KLT44729.1 hypothetical protein CC85DRAFT_202822 [Cutaneotrichosporon oleaginosum]TXT07715.1 hypothetical protein COLE_04639 [Cutaneotrichosporon oleaginosum]